MRYLFCLALLVAGPLASAADAPAPQVIRDIPAFLDHQRDLRAELGTRRYRHLDDDAKSRLRSAQDTLFTLLDGKRTTDELSGDDLIAVFNAQTTVAAVLEDAELDRPLCRRERLIGSNRMQTVCETKRERRDRGEHARELRLTPRGCDGGGGNELCGAN